MALSSFDYGRGPSGVSPFAPFAMLWRQRVLVRRLAARELQARYRSSMLGLAWAVLLPLGMVAVYTFVFAHIMQVRWQGIGGSPEIFAAFLLTGLIVHQLLSECLGRAPGLVIESRNYVTKVVFPLQVLPAVTVASAGVGALIGLAILLALTAATSGPPPWTALLSPLVLLGMAPMLLGLCWLIAAFGVFVRDLAQIMPVVLNALMFLGPVIYPRSAVPEPFDTLILFNPSTVPIEAMRALVFGHPFPTEAAAVYVVVGLVTAGVGFHVFSRLRGAFADVL